MQQVLDALAYIRDKDLPRYGAKYNNILKSDNGTVVKEDFVILFSAETLVQRYRAYAMYSCPEGRSG